MTTTLLPTARPDYIPRSQNHRDEALPACFGEADVFQHPLLEDGAKPNGVEERNLQQMLIRKTENLCLDCPMMVQCLYRAVVECDVDGICAGTTAGQRMAIREELGIQVETEDFTNLAGANSHMVSHDEVLRLRAAYPDESLEALSQRLGCSLSTVKRHLRRARREANQVEKVQKQPTVQEVLAASNKVVLGREAIRRAA